MSSKTPAGRLAGKVALVTGAAGNLGGDIVRRFLAEGASVALSGRTAEKLDKVRIEALIATRAESDRAMTVVMDGGAPDEVRAGVEAVVKRFGRLDIVINNAGSAGPKQPLWRLPVSNADLASLKAEGGADNETVADAMRNILGVTWNVTRAAAPRLGPGASVVNISTIFSRTKYFGRAAYVVPKAALNAMSAVFAEELGPRGVRVNTVYPGPIESDRIRNAFAAMDELRGDEADATGREFVDLMSLARPGEDGAAAKIFPAPADIANICVFLASAESAAFNGHDFDVTHGMRVAKDMSVTCIARPSLRVVDAGGTTTFVAAGNQVEEGLEIARIQSGAGADVILSFTLEGDVQQARSRMREDDVDRRILVTRCDRRDTAETERVLEKGGASGAPISAAIILPAYGAGLLRGKLTEAKDNDVKVLLDHELCGAVTLARSLTRYWKNHEVLAHEPRFVFMSNGAAAHHGYARALAKACRDEGQAGAACGDFILTADMAERLSARLAAGGQIAAQGASKGSRDWLQRTPPGEIPFIPPSRVMKTAKGVGDDVLSLLNLGRMPTEEEVALATVFFLADRAASGQTFQPSGGLALERSVTERELFGSTKRERVEAMKGKTVWFFGEHLVDHIAGAARDLAAECGVAKIVIVTRSKKAASAFAAALKDLPAGVIETRASDGAFDRVIDELLASGPAPTTIVSTPMSELPDVLFGGPGQDRLDPFQFRELVEDNLTQHFQIARRAVLIDGAQLVLVTPDAKPGSREAAFALANFGKTSLHAFTATLAVEAERLVHDVPVNQVNLTRRVRSEEPQNDRERQEEAKRFARAVILAGAPLPDAEDSRYRARIYRGMAITV